MARGNRRMLVLVLPTSLVAAIVLFLGAVNHRLAEFGQADPGWRAHATAEVLLWGGLVLAMVVFVTTFVVFRREVRLEKFLVRRRRQKRELLGALRRYERDERTRMNN